MENIPLKKMYSISDAMHATGLGKTTIYKLINEGKLAAKKFGKRTLITAESIETWINDLPATEKFGGK